MEQLERVRIQIIPRSGTEGYIRGDLGPRQLDVLQAVLPDLKAHWLDVLNALGARDENEAAAAMVRMLADEGEAASIVAGREPSVAAYLGRRGGLKGGKARAEKMTKKQRSESARRAALARWAQPS